MYPTSYEGPPGRQKAELEGSVVLPLYLRSTSLHVHPTFLWWRADGGLRRRHLLICSYWQRVGQVEGPQWHAPADASHDGLENRWSRGSRMGGSTGGWATK